MWMIRYGLGGGFGGLGEWESTGARDEDEALAMAWECACDEYDSYAGSHGIRNTIEIAEEDNVDEDTAEEIYCEERESWLDYEVMWVD